jgi:hypothetical protein
MLLAVDATTLPFHDQSKQLDYHDKGKEQM